MTETTEREVDEQKQYQHCVACGAPAVVTGILQTNTTYSANTSLCGDCYIPTGELDIPDSLASIVDDHTTELLTTPADEVFIKGEIAIIDHGPGEQSRVKIPE